MDIKYTIFHQEVGSAQIPELKVYTRSIAYFCEHCGEVWFRAEIINKKTEWTLRVVPCTHSVLLPQEPWYYNYNVFFNAELISMNVLPKEVIDRELDILLKEAECCKV